MTNPTSIGSTVPGIPPNPTRIGSTKARHGNPRKSPSVTAASWFSTTPEGLKRSLLQTTAAKNILGAAARKAMLAPNDFRSEIS